MNRIVSKLSNFKRFQTTSTFKRVVNFIKNPPPIPYKIQKYLFWLTLSGGVFWGTIFISSGSYILFNRLITNKQEEEDKEEYKIALQHLKISDEEEPTLAWGENLDFWNKLKRRISLIFRLISLSFLFSPLFILYPLTFYSDTLFSNIWCNYLLFSMKMGGPCFIKLAQWIATRRDLFSDAIIKTCSIMHSQAPQHPFYETKTIIEKVLGDKLENLFDMFIEKPIASGSIAQIHIASLKSEPSKWVVLKVRHPNVEYEVYRDLYILKRMASFVSYLLPSYQFMNMNDIVTSFSKNMQMQTDLRNEAKNLLKFEYNFKRYPDILFPKPLLDFEVHPSLLIETYESGTIMTDHLKHLELIPMEQRAKIAQLGTSMFLKMMLVDNFVHADLHPGNILLRDEKENPKLVVLDAGLVSELNEIDKRNFLDLFAAVAEGNGLLAADLMVKRSRNYEELKKNPENIHKFTFEMSKLINQVYDKPLHTLEIGHILSSVLDIGKNYQVLIESNFTTLVIGTIIIEGLGKTLNPHFEFIKTARPFLIKDKQIRDAYIKGQLVHGLKDKTIFEKMKEWFDLFF